MARGVRYFFEIEMQKSLWIYVAIISPSNEIQTTLFWHKSCIRLKVFA